MSQIKTCLLINDGPVPTDQYRQVEGGGIRTWGLAKGLHRNGVDVTVAISDSFPQNSKEYEGIKLCNWDKISLPDLANSFDSVIVRYNMGDITKNLTDHLVPSVQLILDLYVPIYVEESARTPKDVRAEYKAFMTGVPYNNATLCRGDYFICAHEVQKYFYTGVLSPLGRINPITYRENIIGIVPLGFDDDKLVAKNHPFKGVKVDKNDFVILWFGGLYPWFDIKNLIRTIGDIHSKYSKIKLLILGGKNPFNNHPEFVKQYDETLAYAKENNLIDECVFFQDWINYEDRYDWFNDSDIVINLNRKGDENKYSWRTRIVDSFIWGELPLLSNGQDAISEYLIVNNAAIYFDSDNTDSIKNAILHIYENPSEIEKLRNNIKELKPKFYWHNITKDLSETISSGFKSGDADYTSRLRQIAFASATIENPVETHSTPSRPHQVIRKIKHTGLYKLLRKIYLIPRYMRRYGRKAMLRKMFDLSIRRFFNHSDERKYIFLSHSIDQTGAPVVLMDLIDEFRQQVSPKQIEVIAPHIDINHKRTLLRAGIKFSHINFKADANELRYRVQLNKNDFVLINTVAVPHNYLEYIIQSIEQGRLNRAIWFIHEDDPKEHFRDKPFVDRVKKLLSQKKIDILVPSIKMQKKFEDFFGCKIFLKHLHLGINEKYKLEKRQEDFDEIDFCMSGTVNEGRKGHPSILFAFYKFYETYYKDNPKKYRDFKLHFIGMDEMFLSQQIIAMGTEQLKERFIYTYKVTRDEALEYASKCNAVICYSLREAFGFYIAESMYMGSFLLRNDCSGVDEQLFDGKNGYALDSQSIEQFVSVLEEVLNKDKTSNEKLLKMGQFSQEVIAPYREIMYYDDVMKIYNS